MNKKENTSMQPKRFLLQLADTKEGLTGKFTCFEPVIEKKFKGSQEFIELLKGCFINDEHKKL